MTTDNADAAPEVKSSLLYRMVTPKGQTSPEGTRLSFMLLLSMAALGISIYLLSLMEGVTFPRFVMACVVAGWAAMCAHSVRAASSSRRG